MHTKEWAVHAAVILLVMIIFIRTLARIEVREWLIVFLLKAYISSILGVMVVAEGWIDYPVRLLPKYFNNSLLFEYIAFPASCVLFLQTTSDARPAGILLQAVSYSAIMTGIEVGLEKHTEVIRYHEWMWYYTFSTLTVSFLVVRYAIVFVRKLSREEARL